MRAKKQHKSHKILYNIIWQVNLFDLTEYTNLYSKPDRKRKEEREVSHCNTLYGYIIKLSRCINWQ